MVPWEEAMEDEDVKKKISEWPPKNLEDMSVEMLKDYAVALDGERSRVQQLIDKKEKYLNEADTLFST